MLNTKAKHIRKDIIKMLARKGGHPASNLGSADIFTTLYFATLKYHPQKKASENIVVSKHLEHAWHAAMAHSGYFSKRELFGTELPSGAPPRHAVSIAIGRACASEKHTYCIINDEELEYAWETAHSAPSNLTLIINRNNLGATGFMNIEPVRKKFEAFNWNTIEVDGHNFAHIKEALEESKNAHKPTAIIAHTIPGKGISFIENNPEWYEKTPTKEEEQKATTEL